MATIPLDTPAYVYRRDEDGGDAVLKGIANIFEGPFGEAAAFAVSLPLDIRDSVYAATAQRTFAVAELIEMYQRGELGPGH